MHLSQIGLQYQKKLIIKLPKLLKLLMNSLLSKSFPVAERVERLSSSLGQDIIYNMSNGKTKAIKQVQLGITTKRKTGSRLMLDSLNCLGHPISYDETIKSKVRLLNRMSKIRVIDRLYGTMSSLHRVILFTTPVTIIQRYFLVHPYTSQIESLSSFQAKLKNQNSQIVPLQLNFVRRGDPLNQS